MRARLLTILACAVATAGASAQPRVVVRAEARIELSAEHRAGEVVVGGSLVDDLGQPLVRRPVVVAILSDDGRTLRSERQLTDSAGHFSLTARGAPTRYVLTASFAGDPFHPRMTVERNADLSRVPTRLRLFSGDGRIDLDQPSHEVRVAATSSLGGSGLTVELADELGRPLGQGTTGPDGEATVSFTSDALGETGAGRLVASTLGDERRANGRVEAPVVRFRTPSLTLRLTGPESDGRVELEGYLATSAGPLPAEAVGLFAGGRHIDTALTDERGRFRSRVSLDDLPAGRQRLIARFESDGSGTPSVESAPVAIDARRGEGRTWAWLALPLLVSLGVMLWLRRRAPPPEADRPFLPVPMGIVTRPAPRRGVSRPVVSGTLTDAHDRPLAGTLIATRSDGSVRRAAIESDGLFTLDLEAGVWELRFEAPRHAPAAATADLPHRGDLEGMRVRLETWRARALAVLRDAFTSRGATLETWRRTTVHSLTRDDALGPTAQEVESSYYGPLEPDADRLDRLRGPADRP